MSMQEVLSFNDGSLTKTEKNPQQSRTDWNELVNNSASFTKINSWKQREENVFVFALMKCSAHIILNIRVDQKTSLY